MVNLNPRTQIPVSLRANKALGLGYRKDITNTIPTADYMRWVIAYDRFFFFRPLNPTNSFVLSMAYNSSYNLSETAGQGLPQPAGQAGRQPGRRP